MSNYASVDFNNPTSNVKCKFISKELPTKNAFKYQTKADLIDNETKLLKSTVASKEKTRMKLNNNFNPDNYNINYSNSISDSKDMDTYYATRYVGAGRGFGNLNISNDIRNSASSRNDSKSFKEEREGNQLFEYQFQYLDRNFQDPDHLVMPIPRGGDMTRKQNQLVVNTMRTIDDSPDPRLDTIKFNY
jgi:hypothetical protein